MSDEATRRADEMYSHSFTTKEIDQFWSHSWRSVSWHKVLALMMYYNSLPASVISTFAAFIAMILRFFDWLPAMITKPAMSGKLYAYSAWSLMVGLVVFWTVLCSWPSQQRVFLDKVCIHQTNRKKKAQGVESIGAFLQCSKVLLVLWDPSYAKRLWCVFEMAAFSETTRQTDISKGVHIRPVIMGPVFLSLFQTLWFFWLFRLLLPRAGMLGFEPFWLFFSVMPVAALLRVYHRNLTELFDQLGSFSAKNVDCFCCSVNHVNPETGKKLLCDRKIVEGCIDAWYGGIDPFDKLVRVKLVEQFQRELGHGGFPYRVIILAGTPTIWGYMDFFSSGMSLSFYACIDAFSMWLCVVPLVIAFLSALAKWCKRSQANPFADFLSTAGITLLFDVFFICIFVLWQLARSWTWDTLTEIISAATCACIMGGIAFYVFRPPRRSKNL